MSRRLRRRFERGDALGEPDLVIDEGLHRCGDAVGDAGQQPQVAMRRLGLEDHPLDALLQCGDIDVPRDVREVGFRGKGRQRRLDAGQPLVYSVFSHCRAPFTVMVRGAVPGTIRGGVSLLLVASLPRQRIYIPVVSTTQRKMAQSRTMSGAELRARIKRLGLTYAVVADQLGLSLDGLNKQMRGDRRVSRQTEIILDLLDEVG